MVMRIPHMYMGDVFVPSPLEGEGTLYPLPRWEGVGGG